MIGYVWADINTAGASAVVTCSDRQSGIETCTEIAYMYWNNRNKLNFDMHAGEVDKVLKLIPEEFSIVADSGDNPTAGGVGDRADVLEALIKRGIQKVLVAGIAAPGIIKELQTNGHKLIYIGNRLGGGGPIIKIKPEKNYIENECAVVISQGITIVLTEQRRPFHDLRDFTDLGIDLSDFTLLVVKSGYLSPELQSLSAPSYLLLTDGAVCQNFDRLENKFRKRPLFPFENPEEFAPFVSHKQLLSIS
jgi:microcystin degradation protein MlrC